MELPGNGSYVTSSGIGVQAQKPAAVCSSTIDSSLNGLSAAVLSSNCSASGSAFCLPEVYSLDQFFISPTPINSTVTVSGINLASSTTVSIEDFIQSVAFTPVDSISGNFSPTNFVNISSINERPYTYKCFFDNASDIERY